MDRLSIRPDRVEPLPERLPASERAHWERIAEEAVARAFRDASAGLALPGLDGRWPDPPADAADTAAAAASQERPGGRQGFRLALTGSGTSFTPSIGACFHFESLRRLTAASGRELGLKAVIVVRGQVVLLPDTTPAQRSLLDHAPGTLLPSPAPTKAMPLLGLAELVAEAPETEPPRVASWSGLPPCPLWGS